MGSRCRNLASLILPAVSSFCYLHQSPIRSFSRTTLLFSSESNRNSQQHWEDLYFAGGDSSLPENPSMVESKLSEHTEVRVVTFDLDNTLWKTGPTIEAANHALAKFLDSKAINSTQSIPTIMKQLFDTNPSRYAPVLRNNKAQSVTEQEKDLSSGKSPTLLTLLRKDAIQALIQQSGNNSFSSLQAAELAQKAFEVWKEARHQAALLNMADKVHETISALKSSTNSSQRPIVIGAITDGNADPRLIDSLSPYFDFCVQAEQVGVSKPDSRIYTMAVQEAFRTCIHSLQDLLHEKGDQVPTTHDDAERIVGPWWVHIGDDFGKDIVGAKSLGMRSIWCTELVAEKLQQDPVERSKTSKTVDDLVREISGQSIVRMDIGSDDYLLDSLQREFADSIVDRFEDLASVIQRWNFEAAAPSEPVSWTSNRELPPQMKELNKSNEEKPDQSKYCMYCGVSLPKVAKFCSSCGQLQ